MLSTVTYIDFFRYIFDNPETSIISQTSGLNLSCLTDVLSASTSMHALKILQIENLISGVHAFLTPGPKMDHFYIKSFDACATEDGS